MAHLKCTGWWEQAGFGRQPMNRLLLSFFNEQILGTGVDIVGEFELRGERNGDKIYLLKQYLGKHQIEYHGLSLGEGAYAGTWSCSGYTGGKWFIGITRSVEATNATTVDIRDVEYL